MPMTRRFQINAINVAAREGMGSQSGTLHWCSSLTAMALLKVLVNMETMSWEEVKLNHNPEKCHLPRVSAIWQLFASCLSHLADSSVLVRLGETWAENMDKDTRMKCLGGVMTCPSSWKFQWQLYSASSALPHWQNYMKRSSCAGR